METIIYKVQYSDKKYLQAMKDQEDEIMLIINDSNNINYKIVESNLLKNVHSFDRKIDQVIVSMKEYDCLTVSHMEILGLSMHRILKRLDMLFRKNCSLHIINKRIQMQQNVASEAMRFLGEMFQMSTFYKNQKIDAVKNTLKAGGKKTGRVVGKKYKSKFDEYKSKILAMHSKGISKKRICESIEIGTPQAIGKYIKAVNERKEQKSNKRKRDNAFISIEMIEPEKLQERMKFK